MNQNKLEKYLQRPNPSLLNPPENRLVSVVLSDSKGKYLRYQASQPLEHNIVWADQQHEPGRTTAQGLDWVRSNLNNFNTRYPNGFVLFVWLGTCNFCELDANRCLTIKEDITAISAQTIHDLRNIVRLGAANNLQVILLEIPVFCTREWNKIHGHPLLDQFIEQDKLIQTNIQLVNEELRNINLDNGKVVPLFKVDLKRKRPRFSVNRSYFSFSQFRDGLHPNHLLSRYWLRKLAELILLECY